LQLHYLRTVYIKYEHVAGQFKIKVHTAKFHCLHITGLKQFQRETIGCRELNWDLFTGIISEPYNIWHIIYAIYWHAFTCYKMKDDFF